MRLLDWLFDEPHGTELLLVKGEGPVVHVGRRRVLMPLQVLEYEEMATGGSVAYQTLEGLLPVGIFHYVVEHVGAEDYVVVAV